MKKFCVTSTQSVPLRVGVKLEGFNIWYCTAPRAIHWKAALGILEYINGTSEYGITFRRGSLSSIPLEVFADADCDSKATDRRSVSGGLIMCGGASVCWLSRT